MSTYEARIAELNAEKIIEGLARQTQQMAKIAGVHIYIETSPNAEWSSVHLFSPERLRLKSVEIDRDGAMMGKLRECRALDEEEKDDSVRADE